MLAIHMGTVTDFGVCVCVCGCVCVRVCVCVCGGLHCMNETISITLYSVEFTFIYL